MKIDKRLQREAVERAYRDKDARAEVFTENQIAILQARFDLPENHRKEIQLSLEGTIEGDAASF